MTAFAALADAIEGVSPWMIRRLDDRATYPDMEATLGAILHYADSLSFVGRLQRQLEDLENQLLNKEESSTE